MCYVDIDANGRVGIRRSANGSQVTTFSSISAYQVNGQTFASQRALIQQLTAVIFDLPCGEVPEPCCDYTVDSIDLNSNFIWCYDFIVDTFNIGLLFPEVTPVFTLQVNVQQGQDSLKYAYSANANYPGNTTVIATEDLINRFDTSTVFNDTTGFVDLTYNERGFCLSSNYIDINKQIRVIIGSNQGTGVISPSQIFTDGDIVEFGGNVHTIDQTTGQNNNQLAIRFRQSVVSFQVNINGDWTTETPVDGSWERSSCADISLWRIIDEEGTIIDSGSVTCE
jgi:hypothetical protein